MDLHAKIRSKHQYLTAQEITSVDLVLKALDACERIGYGLDDVWVEYNVPTVYGTEGHRITESAKEFKFRAKILRAQEKAWG